MASMLSAFVFEDDGRLYACRVWESALWRQRWERELLLR
jgi:hypothetical protein